MSSQGREAPSRRYEIARYWHEREPEFVPCLWEPGCFACGYASTRWKDAPSRTERGLRMIWNQTNHGLEICHLIPHSLGGSAEAENLVLLCKRCHHAAPDFRFPEYMLAWMRNRPADVEVQMDAILCALRDLADVYSYNWPPTEQDRKDWNSILFDPGFREFCMKNVATITTTSFADKIPTYLAAACEYRAVRLAPGELFGVSEAGAYRYAA